MTRTPALVVMERITVLPKSHDPLLVAMPYALAVFGLWTALAMVPCVARDGRMRFRWLIAAGFAQGTAIWAMHFTGVLAS